MQRLLTLLLIIPLFASSQPASIADKTKGMKEYTGFFNFYWDDKTGKIFLEINKLDTEILYQTSLPAGLGSNDIGLDRGILGATTIVKFTRTGNKVLMIQPNYSYRAVTDDEAEKRAVEESFAQSTLWGFTIEAETNGTVLVDATNFLLRDAIGVAGQLSRSGQGSYSADATRSAIYLPRTKNFPLNTEIETTITFTTSGQPGAWVSSVTPSANAVTLRMHHSFVQLPDNNYTPRVFDARSGYFYNTYYDYATPVSEPIQKYFICRHRLQKKDPTAALSEPVKPIVYYLDNGTPEPIRSALLEGARWWNQAFEAAGYKNAFIVKVLPDSADPMDIRYNMINWVHRSTRGWSFGSAVVDPRTGEIIKGNVTLGSLRVRQDYLIATGLLAPFENGLPADNKMMKMALQRLRQLAAHEVGHTLGLMHNYIASSQGRASVMDYPHPQAKLDANGNIDLSDAYADGIGDWDKVTIAYGYQDFPKGTDESAALNKILTDAAAKGLTFISDRDARDPAGLHPNAHLWDNGKDPVAELKDVMKIRAKALNQFGVNDIRPGTPMAMLEDVLVPVYLYHRYQVEAVTKEVGGMYYSYALRGDGQVVTKSLSKDDQLKALNAAIDCMEPSFLDIPGNIAKLIPPRPEGYDYDRELFKRRTGLAFDPLGAAETAADIPLSFLFNTERLNRMIEYKAMTNGLGVDEMLAVLINRTWKAPRLKGMQLLIEQQNEQMLLTYILANSISNDASFGTKAAMLNAVNTIKAYAEEQLKLTKDDSYKGYLSLTLERIKSPEKAKPTVHLAQPPGSPIGDEE
ncbi:MAG TPA: zinc-dependent metalloprotease [Chitinophagaceae bacterium]|nr:zinc-dependent metalloprotease [Chitinophagaceae bacterium]